MSPQDALRTAALNEYPGGAESLWPRVAGDVTLEVFCKKVRGTDPRFKLSHAEALHIIELTHEAGCPSARVYVTAVAARVDGTVKFSGGRGGADVMQDMSSLMREMSDVVREVAEAGMDGNYSLNERKRILREAGEAMQALQQLIADVEAQGAERLRAVAGS